MQMKWGRQFNTKHAWDQEFYFTGIYLMIERQYSETL